MSSITGRTRTIVALTAAMSFAASLIPVTASAQSVAPNVNDVAPLELPAFTGSQQLNHYLIAVAPETNTIAAVADAITNAGATITGRYDTLGTLDALLTAEQATTLAAHPSIAGVDLDRPVDIDGPEPIPGRYIITLARSTNPTTRAAIVSALGNNVIATYRHAIDGYAVELTAAELKALKDLPGIATIESDLTITLDQTVDNDEISAAGTQIGAPWGLDRTDQITLPLDGYYIDRSDGSGVTAYIIDTGIAAHSDFGDRLIDGRNFYTSDQSATNANDCNGHGTHVAGTVGGITYGLAKGTTLVPVRVFGCEGSTSTSIIIAAIDWVVANHTAGVPAVANMSLGGGASSSLDAAVRSMVSDGIIVAVAAGNSNQDACYSSPAREPQAITVAASTSTDARASFSNFGSCVDLFAPGLSITSTWPSGVYPYRSTNTISGTSMASPHVAGAAAVLWGVDTTASSSTVTTALINAYSPDKISNPGDGTPNRLLYLAPGIGTAPGAPTDVTAVEASGSVTVSWAAPTESGTGDITSYTVTPLNAAGVASTPTCTWTTGPLQCEIGGLRGGTWTFIVRAANPWGSSPASAASNSITIDVTNDEFAGARAMGGLTGSLTDSNAGATWETGEPAAEYGAGRTTKWFRYTPVASGALTIDTQGSTFDTVLGVYTGTTLNNLSRVAANDDYRFDGNYSLQSLVNFAATAGTDYWVRINSYWSSTGTIVLNWDLEAACVPTNVDNDLLCTSHTLTGDNDSHSVDVTGAGTETGEPGSGTRSVWYTYTPTADGELTISRSGLAAATWIDVYTGSTIDTLQAHPDWTALSGTTPSSGTMRVDDKTTYVIRHATNTAGTLTTTVAFAADPVVTVPTAPTLLTVTEDRSGATPVAVVAWGPSASDGGTPILSYEVASNPADDSCTWTSGTMRCELDQLQQWKQYTVSVVAVNAVGHSEPATASIILGNANDTFADATELSGDTGVTYSSNAYATAEPGEPAHRFGPFHSMWFEWTAPADGSLTVDTVGSNYDTTLAAYTGTRVDQLTQLDANDDAGGALTSAVTIDVTTGQTYRIAVDGYAGRTGAIALNWTLTRAEPPSAPTGVRAVATGNDRAIVAWDNPSNALTITGASATANPGGATCTTNGTSQCTVTGLTTGQSYTFTVTVSNTMGTSPASTPSAPVTIGSNGGARTTFPGSWGIDRIDEPALPMDGLYSTANRGDGVIIFIVDTGIAPHDEFGDRLLPGYDGVGDGYGSVDCHGHGTHVASTTAGSTLGVADDALLVPVRVLDCGGGASTSDVVAGLDWVASYELGPNRGVVNMSLGGSASSVLDLAVERVVDAGVVVAVAAGNEAQAACNVSPAREPSAITVGATDRYDSRAWFSNYGSCVDIFGPGVDIVGAAAGSSSNTVTMSGTSMASPHVAGAAALVLSAYPALTPDAVADILVNDATPDVVGGPGSGSPNLLLMVAGESLPIGAAPAAPKQVTAVAGDGTVTVSFVPGERSGRDITSFTVTGTPSGSCTVPAVDQTSQHSCVISGLTNGVAHTFTVTATDIDGRVGALSNGVAATPTAPAAPEPETPSDDDDDVAAEPVIAAIAPDRMLDTRQVTATGTPAKKVGGSNVLELPVLGRSGVPESGVAAVAMNVTVTDTEVGDEGGYLTVFPCGGTVPNVSNLNFMSGQTVANSVIAPVSDAGTVCLYVYGQAHVLADISGAVMEGAGFQAVNPSRRADTRSGLGAVPTGPVAYSILEVPMLGRAGVPDSDVTAVSINLTLTGTVAPDFGGYATVFPCDAEIPNASNLNFTTGTTVPNSVISPLSADGSLCVFVYGSAHVIIDVNGAFEAGVGYGSLVPARLADTRMVGGPVGAGRDLVVQVAGIGGVPYDNVVSASLNVTVVDTAAPDAGGYVTVYPCGTLPDSSTLNFTSGQIVANALLAPLSATGAVCVHVYGQANVIVDVNGYIVAE